MVEEEEMSNKPHMRRLSSEQIRAKLDAMKSKSKNPHYDEVVEILDSIKPKTTQDTSCRKWGRKDCTKHPTGSETPDE